MKRKCKNFFVLILLILVLLFAYNLNLTGFSVLRIPKEDGSINVLFLPEDETELIAIFNHSENIRCAFYDIQIKELLDILEKKKAQIIIDSDNKHHLQKRNNLNIFYDHRSALMHNKFCILDDNIVITGSWNPTKRGTFSNNNNVVIFRSRYLAENYNQEFDELRRGIFGGGEKTEYSKIYLNNSLVENYFCPEDCKKIGGKWSIIKLIKNAKSSVYVAMFSFTDHLIAQELVKAKNRGVDVIILLEKRMRNIISSEYNFLKENGVKIILDSNRYTMHNKFAIIDNSVVETGSFNYGSNANYKNDENIIIIHNKKIAKKYTREFLRLIN